jgi:hypothetical protein
MLRLFRVQHEPRPQRRKTRSLKGAEVVDAGRAAARVVHTPLAALREGERGTGDGDGCGGGKDCFQHRTLRPMSDCASGNLMPALVIALLQEAN